MPRRSCVRNSLIIMTALLLLTTVGAQAVVAPRDGIDCGCTATGAYKAPSSGKAPSDTLVAPHVAVTPGTTGQGSSPNGVYTLTVGSFGSSTTESVLNIYDASSKLVMHTTFLNGSNTKWGFSPDDTYFVFYYANPASLGGYHIKLFDLANLTRADNPAPLYQTDLGAPLVQFTPDGKHLVLTGTSAGSNAFRVIDTRSGDEVFTESTPSAGDPGPFTANWGFSPDSRLLLFHTVSGSPQRFRATGYDVSVTPAARVLDYSHAAGASALRFSRDGAWLLDAYQDGGSNITVEVRDTRSGALVWKDTFSPYTNPGLPVTAFHSAVWGFGPKSASLVYAFSTNASSTLLKLVNLHNPPPTSGPATLEVSNVDITAGFWRFSRCGDTLATVAQGSSGVQSQLYATSDGRLLGTGSSASPLSIAFRSSTAAHEYSVDGSTTWQAWSPADASTGGVPNTAGAACLPPDSTPPAWPSGATLTVDAIAPGELELAWPAATDDISGVALYVIYQDDVEIATTDAGTRTLSLSGMNETTQYRFRVEARDANDNLSSNGPSITYTTPDWTPPDWPAGAAISTPDVQPDSVTLAWPAATDAGGIGAYEVALNGNPLATLAGDQLNYTATGLRFSSDYTFTVTPLDSTGNIGAPLQITVTTAGPPADATPPDWPAGATPVATVAGPYAIDLSWPSALDTGSGVLDYNVYINGHRIATVTGNSFSLVRLSPDTDYLLGVAPRNRWEQEGPSISITAHTDPGALPSSAAVSALISPYTDEPPYYDMWAELTDISQDGRYVTFHSTDTRRPDYLPPTPVSDFRYDRVTGTYIGLPQGGEISADGLHVVYPKYELVNYGGLNTPTITGFLAKDLETGAESPLFTLPKPVEPGSGERASVVDVSPKGDSALISHRTAYWDAQGQMAYVYRLWVVDATQARSLLVPKYSQAFLIHDGREVLYYGRYDTAPYHYWIRVWDVASGGVRTLLTLNQLWWVTTTGDGDEIFFNTTDALVPEDLARPTEPSYRRDQDVYAYDRITGRFELLSRDPDTGLSAGVGRFSASGDGRTLILTLASSNACAPLFPLQDRWTGSIRCVALDDTGPLSADGRWIAYESSAIAENGVHLAALDWQPPGWPDGATLSATDTTETSITLVWPFPDDPNGFPLTVGEFVIYQDGVEVARVPAVDPATGPVSHYTVTGLTPVTSYDFQVEFVDATGAESSNGPTGRFSTSAPPADLAIEMRRLTSLTPVPDGALTYRMTITNLGPADASAVQVVDRLPALHAGSGPAAIDIPLVRLIGSSPDGACAARANDLTVVECQLGALASQASITLDLTVQLLATAAGQTLTNDATVSAPEPDPNQANNRASLKVRVPPATDLGVTITAPDQARPGERLRYDISVVNHGGNTATGVTLQLSWPSHSNFISVTPVNGNCTPALSSNTATCYLPDLPSGALPLQVVLLLSSPPPEPGYVEVTASVGSDVADTVADNNSAVQTVNVMPSTDLTTRILLDDTILVHAGATFTHQVEVRNQGPDVSNKQILFKLHYRPPAGWTVQRMEWLQPSLIWRNETGGACNADADTGEWTCETFNIGSGSDGERQALDGNLMRFRVTLSAPSNPGNYTIEAYATLTSYTRVSDPNPDNNSDTLLAVVTTDPVDIRVTGLEITQGIQNLANDMPLVEGRETYLRAYVAADQFVSGVRAQLVRLVNGVPQGLVVNAGNPTLTARPDGGKRIHSDQSFWFVLPNSWTQGAQTYRVEVNADNAVPENDHGNNSRSIAANFHTAWRRFINFVPMHVHTGQAGEYRAENDPHLGDILASMRALLPVSVVDIYFDSRRLYPFGHFTGREWDMQTLRSWNHALARLWRYHASTIGITLIGTEHYVGTIDPALENPAISGIGLTPGHSLLTWMFSCQPGEDCPLPWQVPGGRTLAHETGHNMKLKHMPCSGTESAGGKVDNSYPWPYPDCRLATTDPAGYYGFTVYTDASGRRHAAAISNDPEAPLDTRGGRGFPLMGYQWPRWISPYEYCHLLNRQGVNCNLNFANNAQATGMATAASTHTAGLAASPGGPYLMVTGEYDTGAGSATLYSVESVSEPTPRTLEWLNMADGLSPDSNFELVQVDAAGAVLATQPILSASDNHDATVHVFGQWLPMAANVAALQIRDATSGAVVAERVASANAPSVTLLVPNGGEQLAAGDVIEWTANDNDGDTLTFTLRYSRDGGTSWRMIAMDLDQSSYTLTTDDLAAMPGSDNGRIQVIANDGFHSASDMSDGPLSTPGSAPQPYILNPPRDLTLLAGEPVNLVASASDAEDGFLEGDALVWRSDRDGELGRGRSLDAAGLSPGTHTITLTATDSSGKSATAEVAVTVFEAVSTGVITTPAPSTDANSGNGSGGPLGIGGCTTSTSTQPGKPDPLLPLLLIGLLARALRRHSANGSRLTNTTMDKG